MQAAIYAIGTADTKGEELAYLASQIRRWFPQVKTVDVGTATSATHPTDFSRAEVAAAHPDSALAVTQATDRGVAVTEMSRALEVWLAREFAAGRVAAVIGIGGSGGTALVAPAFRALPVGTPKLIVSTVASGNTAPYVGCTDISMMYSVVDVAGLNVVSREVLANAAAAIAGMAQRPRERDRGTDARPAVGMTMFGVTTPCVTAVRQQLEAAHFDPLVFHATGTGGQAMEKLVASGLLCGVLDVTTTEVADEIVGGVFPAGAARMDVMIQRGLPYVVSLGALDMVNFGAMETVPEPFRNRRLHRHNAQVTLMRTTVEENRQAGKWIAGKLKRATSTVRLVIPQLGVSALDAPGQPFWDPDADAALFDTLERELRDHPWVTVERQPFHINAPEFAAILVERFTGLLCSETTRIA